MLRINQYILRVLKFLAEGILPLLFWVLIIFGFDKPDVAVLTILTALLHELGHIAAALLIKQDTGRLSTHISGFRIRGTGTSYLGEIIILAAGPLANIVLFVVTLPFGGIMNGYISLIGYISLVTALSNLLPVEGYDGYGILSRLALLGGWIYGVRVLEYISFSISVTLTLFSLYLLFYFGEGYWVFGVFFTLMLSKLACFTKEDVLRE